MVSREESRCQAFRVDFPSVYPISRREKKKGAAAVCNALLSLAVAAIASRMGFYIRSGSGMRFAYFLGSSIGFSIPAGGIAALSAGIIAPWSAGAACSAGGGGGGGASFFAHAARLKDAAKTKLRNSAHNLRIFNAPFLSWFFRFPDTSGWRLCGKI